MCREIHASGLPLASLGGQPSCNAEEVLQAVTKSDRFKGWQSFSKIRKKGLGITHKNVKTAYDAFLKEING